MKLSEEKQLEADQKEFAQIRSNMRAYLKQQSKNDLIKLIFEQLDLYIELRKELKELKQSLEDRKEEKNG
jgi:hypothetical protein